MKILVLMSTYNGEKFLKSQIDSILNQRNVKLNILVRDDGSTDRTCEILDEYKNKNELNWYSGKNLGPARSFMDLVNNAPDADFYAFSDQDDFWLPEKLFEAVKHLKKYNNDRPSLYYSRYTLVDKDLKMLGQTKDKPYVSLTFKQAVVSSGATGCTMVFNKNLLSVLRLKEVNFQIMHDNWAHKVCLALNGNLYFDENSYIYYRQHGNNAIGGETSLKKRFKRHINSAFKDPCYRSRSINALYESYGDLMPEENKEVCKLVYEYHKGLNRLKLAFGKGYRTNNHRIDCIFVIAVLLGVF